MRVVAMLVLSAAVSGCAAYVNIPEQPGDIAGDSANGRNVRAVSVAALRHVLNYQPPNGNYAVALPAGASDTTYQWVLDRMPPTALRHDSPAAAGLAVYEVAAIYIRGTDAQVDVVFPTRSGEKRLMTVWQDVAVDGWFVTRDRLWEIPAEEALQSSRPADAR
jgi:hypothetical protein